ncbi:galactose-1-phosphate uridylyltransferase [Streptomyces sp. AJS327]|uniref:galactose-1-phosphate uridylyltransferase n=1 Tax=Streptomyces sp. AJS327 TaxID=2545265 RepID=UPI0015DDFBAC|nr:galactose-1-phosphate uridylyltransferase [Streptomyces sp. AJS327]MBA0049381.1 galactose-1-phosphate uridylyltransferase [Streptomyces sp. AJS327]
MRKTPLRLPDGREIVYYDSAADTVRPRVPHAEPSGPARVSDSGPARASGGEPVQGVPDAVSALRRDPLLGDWVAVTAHRNSRTYHPPAADCPLCPSTPPGEPAEGVTNGGRRTEIPEPDYEVAVFENRFPSFTGGPGPEQPAAPHGLFGERPGAGRCEVVCFTSDHHASFAELDEERARLVLDVWTDRTAELSRLPGVEQVFCFENRGTEIGVTLSHPHGQVYAYPFVTPRTERMLESAAAHTARTGGRNLFDDVLAAEEAAGDRVVLAGEHWLAHVPHAARWPYQVRICPRRRVPDLTELAEEARAEFPGLYLDLLRRFDRIFGPDEPPTPYIAAWNQAPGVGRRAGRGGSGAGYAAHSEFGAHLDLFTVRRAPGKLKFLAGSESGMNVFINDVPPEAAAQRLREVASG